MKIVHISTNYNGGAGKAAFRLHNALLNENVNSVYVSLGKEPLIDIKGNKTILLSWKTSCLLNIITRIKKKIGLEHRFIKKIRKLNPKLDCLTNSLPISNMRLCKLKEIQDADIVNLHGVAHILDYKTFFSNIQKPIVWTLHDIYPIGGIFHLRTDEAKNFEVAHDFNEEVFNYKLKAYKNYNRGAIISPSNWLKNEVVERNVFRKIPTYEIPNSVPNVYFNTLDRVGLKTQYGIGYDIITLLFVSSDLSDSNKGGDLLLEALALLELDNIHLLIVGGGNQSIFQKYKSTSFGYVSDDVEMANIYNLADIFVIPSKDENLPNVFLESLACGTPIVSFCVGGMVQYIEKGINGELADEICGKSLSKVLNYVINNINNYSRNDIKKSAFLRFNENMQAAKYLEIYNSFCK